MFEAAIHGYLVSLSLILAIGAQNAFVLRQGLRREHVGVVVLACAISDAILIAAGVTGFGAVSAAVPWIGEAMRWGGVIFLLVYGGLLEIQQSYTPHRVGDWYDVFADGLGLPIGWLAHLWHKKCIK